MQNTFSGKYKVEKKMLPENQLLQEKLKVLQTERK